MLSYDDLASGYDALHAEEQARKLRIVREHLALPRQARILDVGCGTGLAATLWDADWTGIDPSAAMLRQAGKRMRVVRGSAEDLRFDDKSFDAVICLSAIHHCDDPAKAVAEMRRVSKGPVAISVLKKARMFDAIRAAIRDVLGDADAIDEGIDMIFIHKE